MRQTAEREMDKRIDIISMIESVENGQVTRVKGATMTRWASMYQQIGKEMLENGKTTGTDRIFWTLRKDDLLFNITGVVNYNGLDYEISSTRQLDNYTMQIITFVKF